jgi:hypothetical protein
VGVYLISENNCEIVFRQKVLTFLDKTYGKPILLPKLDFNLPKTKLSNLTIKLKTIKIEDIPINSPIEIEKFNGIDYVPSLWTIILYFVAFVVLCKILTKYCKPRCSKSKPKINETELQEINLPGGASF